MQALQEVLRALGDLRITKARDEYDLQQAVQSCLCRHALAHTREARLGPRARIDFLCANGVGIEIKQRRPNARQLREQVARYAAFDTVSALVVVAGRGVRLPARVADKPCAVVCLDRLWGVAL